MVSEDSLPSSIDFASAGASPNKASVGAPLIASVTLLRNVSHTGGGVPGRECTATLAIRFVFNFVWIAQRLPDG